MSTKPEMQVKVHYPKENIPSPEAMKVVVQAIIEGMINTGIIDKRGLPICKPD